MVIISFVEYIYDDVTMLVRLAVTTTTGILYGIIALDAFLYEFRQNKTIKIKQKVKIIFLTLAFRYTSKHMRNVCYSRCC